MAAGFCEGYSLQVDPQHSFAQFGVTHLMISKVRGEFHALNGTVNVDESDVTKSSVEVTIDASTIDTREPDRDANLKVRSFWMLRSIRRCRLNRRRSRKGVRDISKLLAILRFMV